MGVPFYNFTQLHHENFRIEAKRIIGDIIDNGQFIEGDFNRKFEADFAKMQNSKHCLLVANGTDAIEISLQVAGVEHGDYVGVPGITFYATAEAVLNIGAKPVHIDVDPETGLMCPKSLKRVSEKVNLKAIVPVHIYGLPAPMEDIEKVCHNKNIQIVEDAAQAQGAFFSEGKPIGSTNNLATFSFYPTKNLSAFGDAGCILSQSDEQAEKIKVIRNHGRGDDHQLGRNSRCDHIQAAMIYLKLKEISKLNQSRKNIATKYHQRFEGKVKILPSKFLSLSSWHLYPIQLESKDQREKLQHFLKDKSIGSAPFYEKTLNQESVLKDCPGEYKNAENFAGKTLCLPIHPFVTDTQIETVTSEVINFLG